MTFGIFGGVLSFPEWHVTRWPNDPGAELPGPLVIPVDVFHVDHDVLGDFFRTGRCERASLHAEHESSLGDFQLGVADLAGPARGPQPFPKAEGTTKPVDRLATSLYTRTGTTVAVGAERLVFMD